MSRTAGDVKNIFYQARMRAAARDTDFESRASTEGIVGISSTRLYQIERGIRQPHRDELLIMAKEYDAPELFEAYCRGMCPLGGHWKEVNKLTDTDSQRIIERAEGRYHMLVRAGSQTEAYLVGAILGKTNEEIQNDLDTYIKGAEKCRISS